MKGSITVEALRAFLHTLEMVGPTLLWVGGGLVIARLFILLWWGLDELFKMIARHRPQERWLWFVLLVVVTLVTTWLVVWVAETWMVLTIWPRAFLAAVVFGVLLAVIALAYITDPVVSILAKMPIWLAWPFFWQRHTATATARSHHYPDTSLQNGVEFTNDIPVEVLGTDGYVSRVRLADGSLRTVRNSSLS